MGFFAKGKKGFPSRSKAGTTSETELTPRMGILLMADHISESESFNNQSSTTTSPESGSIPSLKVSNSWKQKNHFFSSKSSQQHNSTSRSAKKQQQQQHQQNLKDTHKFQRLPVDTQSPLPTLTELNVAAEQERLLIPLALPLPSRFTPEESMIHHLAHTEGSDKADTSSSEDDQPQHFSGTGIKEKAKTKFFSKRKKANKPVGKKFVALDESSISTPIASDDVYEPPQGFPSEFPSDDYGDDQEEFEANLRKRQSVQKIQTKKKHPINKKREDKDACTFQRLDDESSTHLPGLVQDYEPPAFSLQSTLTPDSNEAGYETLTSLEYSGPFSSDGGTSNDYNKPLQLGIDHSFSDPGFDIAEQVAQVSGRVIVESVLNRGNENTQASPSDQEKFSETGSAEFSQFVFDHAFTRIKSVAVEKSDTGGNDGFLSAAVALTAVLSPPPRPNAFPSPAPPSSELENKAQPKKFVIKMSQSKKKNTRSKARDEMPVLREAKGFENLMRKDPTRPVMAFQNNQSTSTRKNLMGECISLPGDSVDGPSVSGSQSSRNENIRPTCTREKIFSSSSEATIVSSESSANMDGVAKSAKKPNAKLFNSKRTKPDSNIIVVDDLDDDPFHVGTQADDTLWETNDDPFHMGSKVKHQTQLRQRGNGVHSESVEKDPLIVCIRQACKRDARDCVKKPDPSPRGMPLASSSSASNELKTTDSNLLGPADGPKGPQPYLQSSSEESDNATGSKTFNTYLTSSIDMTEPDGPKISSVASTSSCETEDSSHDSSGYIMNPINNEMWGKYAAGEFYKPPDSIIMGGAPASSKILTKTSNHTLDIALSMLTTGESEADSDEAVLHGPAYTESRDPGPIEASSSSTPSGIPSNAIIGSMLFRYTHSESTVTLNGSRDKQSGDNEDYNDDDDDDDDDQSMQVPPSVEAIRAVDSNVSSVTEEASSFYKSKFHNSCWNKQAHDVLNNYHKSRTSNNKNSNRSARAQQQLIQAADQGHKYYI